MAKPFDDDRLPQGASLQALMLEIPNFRIEQVTEEQQLDPFTAVQRSKFIIRTAGCAYYWPGSFVADLYIHELLDDRNDLCVHPSSQKALGRSLVRFVENAPAIIREQMALINRLEGELLRARRSRK